MTRFESGCNFTPALLRHVPCGKEVNLVSNEAINPLIQMHNLVLKGLEATLVIPWGGICNG
jgi:hypothetical protein